MTESKVFEGWAVLELMGHRRLAGLVSEVEIAGHGFIRLDMPAVEGAAAATQFYAPAAVYAITPTTEEVASAVMVRPTPVARWELPPARAAEPELASHGEFDPDAQLDERDDGEIPF